MNFNQANKKIAIRQAKEEALKEMKKIINEGLASQMELVMLLVLHDKFGFGAARCEKAILQFEELWDSVNRDYLTLEDIAETVEKEIGLVFDKNEWTVSRKK